MKLRDFKYALLICTSVGVSESYAATAETFVDLQTSSTAYAITGSAVFGASVAATTYSGALTAVTTTADAYLNTTNSLTFSSTVGTALLPVVLDVMNTGTVNLSSAEVFYPPLSGTGGSLRLMAQGGATIGFPVSTPTFNGAAYIDVIQSSTFNFGAALTLTAPIVVETGQTLTVTCGSHNVTLTGAISGAGNIVQSSTDTGVLTIVNTNNASIANIGKFTGTITYANGAQFLAPLILTAGQTYSTPIVIPSNTTQPIYVGSGTANLTSIISGPGNVQKLGVGGLTLAGANTYAGNTIIGDGTNAAGTLNINNATALGVSPSDITVKANSAATLNIATTYTTTQTLTLSAPLTVNVPTGSVATFSGVVSGGYAVTKSNLGTLILGANNSYSGTTLLGGTLALGTTASAGTGAITTSGGTTLTLPTGTTMLSNALTLGTGTTILNTTAPSDNATLTGNITGVGLLSKTGPGAITLQGALNTYSGGSILNAGTVNINANGALGTGDITVAGAATAAYLGSFTLPASGNQDWILNAALTMSVPSTYTGVLNGMMSGSGVPTKSGAGTLTLAPESPNTITSNFLVTAGTLVQGNGNSIFGSGAPVASVGANYTTNSGSHTVTNTGATPIVLSVG